MAISELKFISVAKDLGIPVAAIKAVAEVEGTGHGLWNGKPVILFEPHIFWDQLKKHGVDPYTLSITHYPGTTRKVPNMAVRDILYPTWGERPYPSGQALRWAQVDRAAQIHREAALMSCSWGMFQIMAFNYAATGCSTLQEFINRMYKSEDDQLDLFANYITSENLVKFLRIKAWANFARLYNGPSFKRNNYDVNLERAFIKYSQ
jgi:hypothetical protein